MAAGHKQNKNITVTEVWPNNMRKSQLSFDSISV